MKTLKNPAISDYVFAFEIGDEIQVVDLSLTYAVGQNLYVRICGMRGYVCSTTGHVFGKVYIRLHDENYPNAIRVPITSIRPILRADESKRHVRNPDYPTFREWYLDNLGDSTSRTMRGME